MPKFQIRDCLTRAKEKEINGNNFEENMVYIESQLVEEIKDQDRLNRETEQDREEVSLGKSQQGGSWGSRAMGTGSNRQEWQAALPTARRVH